MGSKGIDIEEDDHLLDDLSQYQSFVKNNKRTMLHNKSTVGWLKSRYPQKTKKHYLLFPEELIEDMKIRKIFKIFDKDNSKALDLEEMVEMFQKYNIEIDKDELQQIYDIVDKTKDNALNYLEFKECAISQDANSIFSKMIQKVRELESKTKDTSDRNIYLPQRFAEMVTYLSYRINRDDLEQYLKERNHRIPERYDKYLQLMNLNGLDSAGATAHENQLKDLKKLDKASDLEQQILDREESEHESEIDLIDEDQEFLNTIKEQQNLRKQKAQFRLSAATNGLLSRKSSSNILQQTVPPSRKGSLVELTPQNNGTGYFFSSGSHGFHQARSNSLIGSSLIMNHKQKSMGRESFMKEEEQLLSKNTKNEVNVLLNEAQKWGNNGARALYTGLKKEHPALEEYSSLVTANQKQKNSSKSIQMFDTFNSSNQKLRKQISEVALHDTLKRKPIVYGVREKFSNVVKSSGSNSHFGLGSILNVSPSRTTQSGGSNDIYRSTFYTLGKREKTDNRHLSELGIEKSSFKSMSNIMGKTLLQIESEQNKRSSNQVKRFQNQTQMSLNLFAQNKQSNIIDPQLMSSVYRANEIQEYQQREKQLITEIKEDIMERFLGKNSQNLSHFEDFSKTMESTNNYANKGVKKQGKTSNSFVQLRSQMNSVQQDILRNSFMNQNKHSDPNIHSMIPALQPKKSERTS